jgi:hypothetical protein
MCILLPLCSLLCLGCDGGEVLEWTGWMHGLDVGVVPMFGRCWMDVGRLWTSVVECCTKCAGVCALFRRTGT